MMQTTAIRPVSRRAVPGRPQTKPQFSAQRRPKELIRDLLRAHSGR